MALVGKKTKAIYELLNGKVYVDSDGIEMVIKHKTCNAIYPYKHISHDLGAYPTVNGKETDAYQKIRKQLRDDWSTDLGSLDNLYEIVQAVGVYDEYERILFSDL